MRKRNILFMIMLGVLLLAIGGCKNAQTSEQGEVGESQYEDSEKIPFYVDEVFNYNIVRPASMDEHLSGIVKSTVFSTARAINEKRPNYLTDADDTDNGLNSILIGETKHPISAEAKKMLEQRPNNNADYVILVKDGNIAIHAISEKALQTALDYFCSEILIDVNSVIPEDYLNYYAPVVETNLKINKVDISQFVIQCEQFPAGMVYRGCEELQNVIEEITEYEVPIVCGDDHQYDYRILVATEGEDKDAYGISLKGKDLVISGGHDYSLNAGIHALAMSLKNYKQEDSINIPKDFEHEGIYDEKTLGTEGYRLVWADEFEGTELDTNHWRADSYEAYGCKRGDSYEVKDGQLIITGEPTTLSDGSAGYTGADIQGKNVNWTYGYCEIRAKVPKGAGCWPSFWFLGENTPGHMYKLEVDVYEFFGTDNQPTSQIHTWWTPNTTIRGLKHDESQKLAGHIQHLTEGKTTIDSFSGGPSYKPTTVDSLADDWHTYGCEWTPSYMKFYCDGFNYLTVDLKTNLTHPEHGYRIAEFLAATDGAPVNFAIGLLTGANVDYVKQIDETTEIPAKYCVDYVHLYQMETLGKINIVQE